MAKRSDFGAWTPVLLIGLAVFAATTEGGTGVLPFSANQALDRSAIYLAATTLHPVLENSLHRQAQTVLSGGHYVIQLDGPLTADRRTALEQAGIVLGDYLPFHSHVIHVDAGYDAARLTALEFVRWIGAYQSAWKQDPQIGKRIWRTDPRRELANRGRSALSVTLFPGVVTQDAIDAVSAIDGATVHCIETAGTHEVLRITMPTRDVARLVEIGAVQFVEDTEEAVLRNASTRWIVQSNRFNETPLHDHGLNGAGQIAGLLDTTVYIDHCSFFDNAPIGPLHRKVEAVNQWTDGDPTGDAPGPHGTHVACTLLGDAGVDDNTRGIAFGARFVSNTTPVHDGPGIMSRLELHSSQGAVVHSNSWGDPALDYGSLTRGVDVFCHEHEDELVVFACGNDTIAANPQNAKNCVSVSATMDTPNQDQYCIGGAGPTVDGRRKPEICAPGCNTTSASVTACLTQDLTGTSMATPVISGVALLMRQYYRDGYYPTGSPRVEDGFIPTATLVKATLLNSTVDLTGVAGYPSDTEGWGRILADDALYFPGDRRKLIVLDDVRNVDGLSTGEMLEYQVLVAGDEETFKVTMAFNDPPGGVGIGNGPAWVNDLDLEVVSPSSQLYYGNAFVGGASAPAGAKDDRNNVEQVHIPSPETGLWTVRVRAAEVNQGTQGFALIATGDVPVGTTALALHLPEGVPAMVPPIVDTPFFVDIVEGTEIIEAETPTLHYRYHEGPFATAPLLHDAGNRYVATLPGPNCISMPEYYLSVSGDGGTTVTLPADAPATLFSSAVGAAATVFSDDFETDAGWTVINENLVSGAWVRVVPSGNGQLGDPTSDYDGSGHCYVTGAGMFQDVNGGPTRLFSRSFDLSNSFDPQLTYARWFQETGEGDTLVVELSNDDGANWVTVEVAGETAYWTPVTVRIADFITPTAAVRVRFSTQDLPNNSFTEAGVDAVRIDDFGCEMPCTAGDMNGDGATDGRDISRFVQLLLGDMPTAYELCAADLDAPADLAISTADVDEVVGCLLGNCGN